MEKRREPKEQIERFETSVLTDENLPQWKDQILDLILATFPDDGGDEIRPFYEKMLVNNYMRNGVVVVLTDALSGSVSGFTGARIYSAEPTLANIGLTAIRSEDRGKKLVAELIGRLESELKTRGVTHITRQARVADGYADAIERHYGDRIVEKAEMPETVGDLKRSFKIML